MQYLVLFLNLAVVVFALTGTFMLFGDMGQSIFFYYTVDGNILGVVACTITLFFMFRNMRDGTAIPEWVKILKFTAVCCLVGTFTIVVCMLVPMGEGSYQYMLFSDSMFFHHLLAPAAILLSFIFERDLMISEKVVTIAMIPTAVYGTVMLTLNVLHMVDGPYPFLQVYGQPLLLTVTEMIAVSLVIYAVSLVVYHADFGDRAVSSV